MQPLFFPVTTYGWEQMLPKLIRPKDEVRDADQREMGLDRPKGTGDDYWRGSEKLERIGLCKLGKTGKTGISPSAWTRTERERENPRRRMDERGDKRRNTDKGVELRFSKKEEETKKKEVRNGRMQVQPV
jgi:hypothetical protein